MCLALIFPIFLIYLEKGRTLSEEGGTSSEVRLTLAEEGHILPEVRRPLAKEGHTLFEVRPTLSEKGGTVSEVHPTLLRKVARCLRYVKPCQGYVASHLKKDDLPRTRSFHLL